MEEKELETMIGHWKDIIYAVFSAEEAIQDKIKPPLKEKKITPDQYVEEVAKEILSKGLKKDNDGK
jgi:hypothetical protein